MTATLNTVAVKTPGGNTAVFAVRPDTSDGALVFGIIGEDEYGLRDLPPIHGTVIDIGGHIGTVAVTLALDHPDIHVVTVEALHENVAVIRESVKLNRLEDRITVIDAAATDDATEQVEVAFGWHSAENQPDHYMWDNRYVGGMVGPNETSQTEVCTGIGLAELTADLERVALLKIDCEGCEWSFLTSMAVAKCDLIWGEYHEALDPKNTYAALLDLLTPTHNVEHIRGENVGIFRAVRRV